MTRSMRHPMDENPSPETPAPADPGLNKLDLSQLQGFSFGTQWTQEKHDPRDARRGDDRPRREDRRDGPGGPDRRDRRGFRRPAGDAPAAGPGGAPSQERREGYGGGGGGGPRGEFRGGPRRDFRGGPRRDEGGEGRGGPRGDYRGGGGGGRGGYQAERGPYESPFYTVTFYPEDSSFATLAKTIRSSCRTIELFEIARTVIGKLERFVVVLQRKSPAQGRAEAQPAAPAAEGAAPAPHMPGVKPAPLYISVPDNLPFETEDAAIAHVLQKHLGQFFEMAEVDVEPPKGNFQIVNRCGVTGELLGPPNYHRYNQIVQQHFAARIHRMPFDLYRSKIESVRDPEVVNQWLEKMKKVTRYTWKSAKPAVAATPAPAPATEGEETAAPAEPQALSFDTIEDARVHLLTHAREKVVRMSDGARFHGAQAENLPPGEIRRAVEGALERQRRFPLDTANALRGRLRREGFTIFKKGSKGISYVCAVKRKFRVPGQTFSDSINNLITYIEAHPMVRATELSAKFLGIDVPKAPEGKQAAPAQQAAPAAEAAAPAEAVAGDAPAPATAAPVEAPTAPEAVAPAAPAPAEAKPEITVEQREKIARMQGDLLWLVREGYVTEFIDGRLFAPPPMVEARKKEVESEEHDLENFPEAPAADVAPAPAAPASDESPAGETSAPEAPSEALVAPASEETAPEATAEEQAPSTEAPALEAAPEQAPAPEAAPDAPATEPEKPAQG